MVWVGAYAVLVLALFIRFQDPNAPRRAVPAPGPDEPLWIVRWHHRLVYAVLALGPIEALVLRSWPGGRLVGLVLMGAGVALHRWGATVLGDALSPLLSPVPGAPLVRRGPYAFIRHPMYLGQMMMLLGAPLLIGARFTIALAVAGVALIAYRMDREDHLLEERVAGYREYARTTNRILPGRR